MNIELRLLDRLNLSNQLSRNFVCGYSEDDRLFIIADTGVYILALKCSLADTFSNWSCSKQFLQLSEFIPSANIDLDINSFHKDLERKDLYETVMTTEYAANLKHTKPFEVYPLCAEWSPPEMVGSTTCLLAVLSNVNSLEIFVKFLNENEIIQYVSISNVTREIINIEKCNWSNTTRFAIPLKLEEFKKRVCTVSPTAFTWSHRFKTNGSNCVIFVGHINGDITLWRIHERSSVSREESKLHFLGRYSTQLKQISTMHWHATSEYGGGLSFGDLNGRVSVLHVTNLNQDKAHLDKELGFWVESDEIMVDKITVMVYGNRTYIIVAKQRILIIYGIDNNGKVFDQKICYIEEYYITGIHHYKNIILVLSLPGIFTQLTLSVENEKILLEEKRIPLKFDKMQFRTHGFFCSKNMILFGMLSHPWDLQQYTDPAAFITLSIYNNYSLNPLQMVWNNTSGSLRNYWDCFEALRLICLKEKRFPWIDLPLDLNYDELTILQLKTLRCIAKLSETVFASVPVVKDYHIKPFILLHYVVEMKVVIKRLKKLFSMKKSGKELTLFQMRSIDIQNFFLKEMIAKNIPAKANMGKNFIRDIREVMEVANELKYPDMMQCIWCGEKIIGSLCHPPHADSRCSFSMMPIFLIPGHRCPFCKSLAHTEIKKEEAVLFCPYCDIPMESLPVNSEKYAEYAKQNYNINCSGEVKSVCFEDCLKEEVNLEDIEENPYEYVILSDSDSDSDEQSQLRKLYLRMSKVSLKELQKFASVQDSEGDSAGPSRKIAKLNSEDME